MAKTHKFTPNVPPVYSVFATRLRQLRKQANLKQEDLAQMLMIHRTAYTKYETDRANPDQDGLIKLASTFGVTVDYLLGNDSKPDTSPSRLKDDSDYMLLDVREQALIAAFRQLPEHSRDQIVQNCCDQAKKQKKADQ